MFLFVSLSRLLVNSQTTSEHLPFIKFEQVLWQLAPRVFHHLDDRWQILLVATSVEGDRLSSSSRTARSSYTTRLALCKYYVNCKLTNMMNVVEGVRWQVIVDHQIDSFKVDASAHQFGAN